MLDGTGWVCFCSLPFDTLSLHEGPLKAGLASVSARPVAELCRNFSQIFLCQDHQRGEEGREGAARPPASEKEVAVVLRRKGEERGTTRQPSNSTATDGPPPTPRFCARGHSASSSVSRSLSLSLSRSFHKVALSPVSSVFLSACCRRRRRRRSRLKSTPHSEIYRCAPSPLSSPLLSSRPFEKRMRGWRWMDRWARARTGMALASRRRLLLSSLG